MGEEVCIRCKQPTSAPTREGLCAGCLLTVAVKEAPAILRTAQTEFQRTAKAAGDELVEKVDRHPIGRAFLEALSGSAARARAKDPPK